MRSGEATDVAGQVACTLAPVERKHLGGVKEPLRVEHGLDPHLHAKVGRRELHAHQVALLDADAVLSREAAADVDTQLQDLGPSFLGALRLGFSEQEINGGGLEVTTTFTPKAMDAAMDGMREARPEGFGYKELHVAVATVEPGTGAVRLTWESAPGEVYGVYRSSDLDDWTEIESALEAEGDEMIYLDPAAPPDSHRLFYQVVRFE